MRLFWSLITLGLLSGSAINCFWTYYEVMLRRDVPDLFAGDVVLFLHIVPLMAALALRPHVPRDEYAARLGRLDFALLLVWWFYLYVLIVMPWQYVVADVAAYNRNLNAVYSAENSRSWLGLFACWITSKGHWRNLYASLFGIEPLLRRQFHAGKLGHRAQRLLQRQPLRYSSRRLDGVSHLDWPRTKAEKPHADARAKSPRSTACGSRAAA